ncbi:expressed unknown protein [Seminavis robusta]|uniref:Uncharacterized protein n=1 Tax=Seminavis robusta TaxID=568900 RepID=A0A9N8DJS9_9STRA|nr:expressed unknown protein [Seminavis robusta]|eukprot:Sro197_g083770.1 n/a (187) ;mRNA; r:29280-29840
MTDDKSNRLQSRIANARGQSTRISTKMRATRSADDLQRRIKDTVATGSTFRRSASIVGAKDAEAKASKRGLGLFRHSASKADDGASDRAASLINPVTGGKTKVKKERRMTQAEFVAGNMKEMDPSEVIQLLELYGSVDSPHASLCLQSLKNSKPSSGGKRRVKRTGSRGSVSSQPDHEGRRASSAA